MFLSKTCYNQNLRNDSKAVLRGNSIAINANIKKQEVFQINNLTFHLKELGTEQTKPKVGREKERTKIIKQK